MYVRIHVRKLLKRRECLIKSIFNPTSTNRLNTFGFYCYGVLFFYFTLHDLSTSDLKTQNNICIRTIKKALPCDVYGKYNQPQ